MPRSSTPIGHRSRFARAAGLLTSLVLMVAACGSAAPPEQGAQSPGANGTPAGALATKITVAWAEDQPADLDRQIGARGSVTDQMYVVTDPIMKIGVDGSLTPGLAESWTDVDASTLRIKLRQDVTFSDGAKFDANAFKASMDRLLSPESRAGASSFPTLHEVKVVDPYTVDLIHDPNITLAKEVALSAYMYSPKQMAESPDSIKTGPIGTGPYVVKSYQSGSSLVLQARDDYWGKDVFANPTIKDVDIRFGLEPRVRLAMLQSGEAQLAMNISPDDAKQLNQDQILNLHSPELYFIRFAFKQPITADPNVRHAINLAVDRKAIAQLFGGLGDPASQMWPRTASGWVDRPVPTPDVATAKSLIEQAGYAGQTIHMTYSADYKPQMSDVAQALAGMIGQTGLTVELRNLDSATYKTYIRDLDNAEPLTVISVSYDTLEATRTLDIRVACAGTMSTYCNPDVDALYQQAVQEPDVAKRTAILQQIEVALEKDDAVVPLVNPPLLWAKSAKLDFTPLSFPAAPFATMTLHQ